MNIQIFPPEGMLEASVDLPLSKSMSARALVINKTGGFDTSLELSDSEDTRLLAEGIARRDGEVNVGNAGTAMRFLTAYFAATEGVEVVLDGTDRMRERPIAPLVEALRGLGAEIEYVANEGFCPIRIKGRRLRGGSINVDATTSSQFVSALMMVAPLMDGALSLCFDTEIASLPYVKMTAAMMTACGIEPEFMYNRIEVPNTPYTKPVTRIERDWSAASYWYSIVALSAGWVTLNDMQLQSVQGDSVMQTLGEKIGVVTSESEEVEDALELSASPEQFSRLDLDMSGHPDLVPTIAIAAGALGIPFRMTGVHTLRKKETDRLEALRAEALKLGLIFEIERDNVLSWEGTRVPITELPVISTYNDHRMAMAFAPISIFLPGIIIENCEVVSKSYPGFWSDLENAGFEIKQIIE